MKMWIVIFLVAVFLVALAFSFISLRITKFFSDKWSRKRQIFTGFGISLLLTFCLVLTLDLVNAMVCLFYISLIWGICDFVFWIIKRIFHLKFKHYYAGVVAIVLSVFVLCFGWYLDHNVWVVKYKLSTEKNVQNLRIVMFADSHLGTTFDSKVFVKHIENMQVQNPDVVFIVGDYVDDSTSKKDMVEATELLGKIKAKYGIYFVFGNHDKGYYGPEYRGFSEVDLVRELEKNSIKVLRDDVVFVDNSFYIIGRKDFSEVMEKGNGRKSMSLFVEPLDKSKYMIVLDHQPVGFEEKVDADVDLVLSGHTHGGQLFPFNQVGKWIGANDLVYGFDRQGNTNFIVTSGISDWAIKFKTGTKSEFVVIDVEGK